MNASRSQSDAECDELTEHAAPRRLVEIRADSEYPEAVVRPLQYALGLSAAQDVDQVHGAESLPRAVDGRQRLARSFRGVPRFRRIDARVAVAAGSARFAEIVEQPNAAAACGFAQAEKRVELAARYALVFVARIRLLDQPPLLHEVSEAVTHPRVGGQAIAAGTSRFLIVALDALRQIQMRDESHVRLVDPHSESDRRHDDDAVVALETRLVRAARRAIHARVIRQRADTMLHKPGGRLVDLATRQTIDDAGVAGVLLAYEAQELTSRVDLVDDRVSNVRPIEARDEHPCGLEPEPRDDLHAGLRVGRCGQGDPRHVGKALVQQRELQVFGPEIVPPLRDAMRLVDREQRDLRSLEQLEAARRRETLRRDVDEVELAGDERALDATRFVRIDGRIERRCAYAELGERGDLILHQRDQRRHDDTGALTQ